MPDTRDLERALRRHVLDPWFPRCLDHAEGGFLCDFDRRWESYGRQHKLLEFQARQTMLLADVTRAYPDEPSFRAAALHGLRYMAEVMWDRPEGGWFQLMDRSGRPLLSETKHAHGAAYAIQACAMLYEATGEPGALQLARDGFDWLERCSRDPVHGGYFGFLTRDGRVILDPADSPLHSAADTVGTQLGLKDANVHSDLLETLVHLYRIWPDPRVGDRLAEVLDIMADRMVVPSLGAMHMYMTPDWRPVPHLSRTGYQCQTAYRISIACDLTGDAGRLLPIAARLVDHTIRVARDRRGGFRYAAPGAHPRHLQGEDLLTRDKPWWVQMEALKALRALGLRYPERTDYREEFDALWTYLERELFDARYGGLYTSALDSQPRWRRGLGPAVAARSATRKGDMWKDGSHDGRALLYCAEHPAPAAAA